MVLIAIGLIIPVPLSAETPRPEQQMEDYFDMLVSGNFESAGYMWSPVAQERSTRFGIEFDDIIIKADCSSPIMRDLELMKDYLYQPVSRKTRLPDSSCFRTDFTALVLGQKIEHPYYLCFENGYYWLTFPQEVYCSDWPVVESEYLRVHYYPPFGSYVHPVVLREADRYIEMIFDSLGMEKDKIRMIKDKKIEYFYCPDENFVNKITGFTVKGTLDLASNDIISSFFPHYHEIVHLLVNIKIQRLPLYTLPLLREGIAVELAGRWGKLPGALLELGSFVLQHEIIDFDSVLTMKGFQDNATSDIVYPVAGLFSSYLVEKIGMESYLALYWAFSGKFDQVYGLKDNQIENLLIKAVGMSSWEELRSDFDDFAKRKVTEYAEMLPGNLAKGKEVFVSDRLSVREDKHWVSFECHAPAGTAVAGNLLFNRENEMAQAASILFEEQYNREFPFEAYRFGIRYDKNEVGLYDYATNHLVAKYIWGISPSELYYDSTANTVNFKVRKDLLDGQLPSQEDHLFLTY